MSTNCVSCIKNKRTEIDLLCDDCRMVEIKKAIKDIRHMQQIHIGWAERFEADPDVEREYVETGEWDTAEAHRNIIKNYDRVLRLLAYLKIKENAK